MKVKFSDRLFPGSRRLRQAAMSLIEIIIVIALLGVIMGVVVTNVIGTSDTAMVDAARLSMQRLESDLQKYYIHMHRFPTTDQGLSSLVSNPGDSKKWRGPYTDDGKLQDPWGVDFGYESDGRTYQIISAGPDNSLGTEDDIFLKDAEGENPS